jgi:hypothetical protein
MVPSWMRELVVVFRRNLQLTPIMGSRHILCFKSSPSYIMFESILGHYDGIGGRSVMFWMNLKRVKFVLTFP